MNPAQRKKPQTVQIADITAKKKTPSVFRWGFPDQWTLFHFQFNGDRLNGLAVLILDHAIDQTVLDLRGHLHRIGGLGDGGLAVLSLAGILHVPSILQAVAGSLNGYLGGLILRHGHGLGLGHDGHSLAQQEGLGLHLLAVLIGDDAGADELQKNRPLRTGADGKSMRLWNYPGITHTALVMT